MLKPLFEFALPMRNIASSGGFAMDTPNGQHTAVMRLPDPQAGAEKGIFG